MDREALALSLKLPKESSEAVIFEALAKRDAEGRKAVDSLAKLVAQLPGFGIKLDGETLSRVEPVALDLLPDPADTPKEAEFKKRLLAVQAKDAVTAATANKEFVAKLAKDMKLPPAMVGLAEELLSCEGGGEALLLSKDGKTVNRAKIGSIAEKAKSLLSALSSLGGVKFATPESQPDEALASTERKKIAEELAKKVQGETTAAAK